MWTASYFAELTGGATSLVVTPAQHRVQTVGDSTAIRRLYESLGLRLFYADANDSHAALATAPAISDVGASLSGSTVTFSARVHGTDDLGDDNLKTAWITYSYGATGCSCWQSIELTRTSSTIDSAIWTATLDITATPQPICVSSSRPPTALPSSASTTTRAPTTRSPAPRPARRPRRRWT